MTHAELTAVYEKYYRDEPFVRLYPAGRLPDLAQSGRRTFAASA